LSPNPFQPKPGDIVHFRKKAIQSDLRRHYSEDGGIVPPTKTETVIEAIGEIMKVTGDGRVTIKMTSWQDDCETWINAPQGVKMNVHIDDIDL
jgi:hypothetical protein